MKVKDGIIGLVVGDALGVPHEFTDKVHLEETPVTEMEGYGTWNQPKGTWSDDSSMTMATMTSIINKNGIDYDNIMDEFIRWHYDDEYTNSDSGAFDIGNTTGRALRNYKNGKPALESGCGGEGDNGNGSLMRILPLAFIDNIDYETIETVSALTHAHERSRIACVLYIEIAKSMLKKNLEIKEHVDLACDKIKRYYKDSDQLIYFEKIFSNTLDDVEGRTYVVGSLECVIHCLLTTDNYEDAVLKAVNIGGDTDTNAAICGGLAGIYYGFDSIPIDWMKQINKIDKVLSLCEKYEAYCDES